MPNAIFNPDFVSLLPPLLACLPTAFASPQPPPALLPLLSPILRQRVQLLAATPDSPTDSWLPLLCWKPGWAEKLASIVRSDAFELHPVSGEIEYGELDTTQFRQLDEETLHARVKIGDLGLAVIYLWCQGDEEGGGDGWRVSEVIPLTEDDGSLKEQWWPSVEVAQQEAGNTTNLADGKEVPLSSRTNNTEVYVNGGRSEEGVDGEAGDDDDYWAQYDKTPGRTPAVSRSPMQGGASTTTGRGRTTSEAAYFQQYSQVQPEMDNGDPSQDKGIIGEYSLNGNILADTTSRPPNEQILPNGFPQQAPVHDPIPDTQGSKLSQPTAASPTAGSDTVSKLEDSATMQLSAEAAVRQHVSTSIKSLFRLCRATGIDRPEFDEMVKTELETLSMLTEDD